MKLEKIMTEEPFVITTYHNVAKPTVKPGSASEQVSLPISHEGDCMLVKDKTGSFHFQKRQASPNALKKKSMQSKASQKSLGSSYIRLQRFAELAIATVFLALRKGEKQRG